MQVGNVWSRPGLSKPFKDSSSAGTFPEYSLPVRLRNAPHSVCTANALLCFPLRFMLSYCPLGRSQCLNTRTSPEGGAMGYPDKLCAASIMRVQWLPQIISLSCPFQLLTLNLPDISSEMPLRLRHLRFLKGLGLRSNVTCPRVIRVIKVFRFEGP